MHSQILFKLLILLTIVNKISSIHWFKKSQSPCPRMFQYIRTSTKTEWFGILSWSYDKSLNNLDKLAERHTNITIMFSLPEPPDINQYMGHIELVNKTLNLYKIIFPVGYDLPKLLEIRSNDRIICKGFKRNILNEPFIYTLKYYENTSYDHYEDEDKRKQESLKGQYSNFIEYDAETEDYNNDNHNNNNEIYDQFYDLLSLKEEAACGIINNRKRFQVLKSLKKQMSSKYYFTKKLYLCLNTTATTKATDINNFEANEDTVNEKAIVYKKMENTWQRVSTQRNVAEEQKSEEIVLEEDDIDSYDLNTILYEESLNEMKRGAWPWMAAIYTHNITSLIYQCSGTLITNNLILTTANCIVLLNKNEILISLGRYNLRNWDERHSLAIPINDIIIHPEYKQSEMKFSEANNIALLKLALDVQFKEYIQPACLDYNNKRLQNIDGDIGVVVSWMTGAQSIGIMRSTPKIIGARMLTNQDVNQSSCHSDRLNNTFCARDILLPGRFHIKDIGAGFLLYNKRRWFLKGILINVLNICNKMSKMSNYTFKYGALFIDVNKYLHWINFYTESNKLQIHLPEY